VRIDQRRASSLRLLSWDRPGNNVSPSRSPAAPAGVGRYDEGSAVCPSPQRPWSPLLLESPCRNAPPASCPNEWAMFCPFVDGVPPARAGGIFCKNVRFLPRRCRRVKRKPSITAVQEPATASVRGPDLVPSPRRLDSTEAAAADSIGHQHTKIPLGKAPPQGRGKSPSRPFRITQPPQCYTGAFHG